MHVLTDRVTIQCEREVRERGREWDRVRDHIEHVDRRAREVSGDDPRFRVAGCVRGVVPCPVERLGGVELDEAAAASRALAPRAVGGVKGDLTGDGVAFLVVDCAIYRQCQ